MASCCPAPLPPPPASFLYPVRGWPIWSVKVAYFAPTGRPICSEKRTVGTRYEEWRGDNNFYVFVRFLRDESRFEAFLESAGVVARQVRADIERFQARGLKDWAPCWALP